MAGAARKSKLTTYEVILKRQLEYTAVLEVEARNAEEAVDVAFASADGLGANDWREGDIISQDGKAKVKRG